MFYIAGKAYKLNIRPNESIFGIRVYMIKIFAWRFLSQKLIRCTAL